MHLLILLGFTGKGSSVQGNGVFGGRGGGLGRGVLGVQDTGHQLSPSPCSQKDLRWCATHAPAHPPRLRKGMSTGLWSLLIIAPEWWPKGRKFFPPLFILPPVPGNTEDQ